MGGLAPAHSSLPDRTRLPGRLALKRRKKGDGYSAEVIPLTVPEVRRLILAMTGPYEERDFRLGWSLWRRAHQAVAKRCHAAKRETTPPWTESARWRALRACNDATNTTIARTDVQPPFRHPVGSGRVVGAPKRRPWQAVARPP